MNEWDAWRAGYDTRSYEDELAFYDQVWLDHRGQRHFNLEGVLSFFKEISASRVLELGGWDGELAALILAAFPIKLWRNIELCRGAVEAAIPKSRYQAVILDEFVWNRPAELRGFDTLVLSHVIEHMRAKQLESIIDGTDAKWVFVGSPLDGGPTDWTGYTGTHILEIGWPGVIERFSSAGFAPMLVSFGPEIESRYVAFGRSYVAP